jgi:hypothetical protein
MTKIGPHLNVGALEVRYKTASDPVAKSHFHAIWLLALGRSVNEKPRKLLALREKPVRMSSIDDVIPSLVFVVAAYMLFRSVSVLR